MLTRTKEPTIELKNQEMPPVGTEVTPTTSSPMEQLATIYGHPGPFTTIYFATQSDSGAQVNIEAMWQDLRRNLEMQNAPLAALSAVEARLALPIPADTAAVAIIAASDGSLFVDFGLEPPAFDHAVVDALPHAGPLLEWYQRRIAHLVVTVDETGADIAVFGKKNEMESDSINGSGLEIATAVSKHASESEAELIVVAGNPESVASFSDLIRPLVDVNCRVVSEPDAVEDADLATAAVRHVSDVAARATVGHLRERRFLAAHDSAVDGAERSVSALAQGKADLLLIHDDPNDTRKAWFGTEASEISVERDAQHTQQGRLVDTAIRSAVLQQIPVHIIPSTGPSGPDDNIAVVIRDISLEASKSGGWTS